MRVGLVKRGTGEGSGGPAFAEGDGWGLGEGTIEREEGRAEIATRRKSV